MYICVRGVYHDCESFFFVDLITGVFFCFSSEVILYCKYNPRRYRLRLVQRQTYRTVLGMSNAPLSFFKLKNISLYRVKEHAKLAGPSQDNGRDLQLDLLKSRGWMID